MPSTKIRDRDRDRDRDSPRSKERDKHKSSRSSRKTLIKERESTGPIPERSATITSPPTKRRTSMPIPELQRRASSTSPGASKANLPYPSFSKAHSKEAVGSREDVVKPRLDLYTPEPTDLNGRKRDQKDGEVKRSAPAATTTSPPSPPLTAMEPVVEVEDGDMEDEKESTGNIKKKSDIGKNGMDDGKESTGNSKKKSTVGKDGTDVDDHAGRRSHSSTSKKSFWRPAQDDARSTVSSSLRPKSNTPVKMKPKPATVDDASSVTNHPRSTSPTRSSTVRTGTDSDATSRAPNQAASQQPFSPDADDESSPTTEPDSSPRTPTARDAHFPTSSKVTQAFGILLERGQTPAMQDSPMPPPPPPPPTMPFQVPRVDYLMRNGGLPQPVSKTLLGAVQPVSINTAYQAQPISSTAAQVEKFFAPFNGLLDDYTKVISKSGSLAVATGYPSIARRLLDRLEAVFARDISSEVCECIMCQTFSADNRDPDDQRGVSWGEILEYVCGRQELPPWPAFTLDPTAVGLGISATDTRLPMQKLDIDVPEEYREHYIRQSKKTKQSVDKWLASQPDNPSSPPQEVDDETLTFAMLTHLDPEQRPIFSALLGLGPSRPPSRLNAPVPHVTPSPLIKNTTQAIQRLYRLPHPPRDPETAIYLLHNHPLHNVLATLAAISDHEWDILISGRFDGFLRSGADDLPPTTSANPSRLPPTSRGPTTPGGLPHPHPPSRNTTPAFSRTQTPASLGAPVALDEETEIAVLAEIEREIYLGMEALEDAFEALHVKAESVRGVLRERGAGLSVASRVRGGGGAAEARLGTPASAGGGGRGWDGGSGMDGGYGGGGGGGGGYGEGMMGNRRGDAEGVGGREGDGYGDGDGNADGDADDGAESELWPDDSASNFSRSRVRRPRRRGERRGMGTPGTVVEED